MGTESPSSSVTAEKSPEWRRQKNRDALIVRLGRYVERLHADLENIPAQPGWFFHLKRWRLLSEIQRVEAKLKRLRNK